MRNLVALTVIVLSAFSLIPSAVEASLISHWKFDGDLTDETSSGNDLSVSAGAAAFSGTVGGTFSTQSLSLNGSTMLVDASPTNTAFASGQYTVAGWFQTDVNGTTGHRGVFARSPSVANKADIYLYIQNSTNQLVIGHNNVNTGSFDFASFPVPPDDVLFHMALTYDGTNPRIYYDGVEQGVLSGWNGVTTVNAPDPDALALFSPLMTASHKLDVGQVDASFGDVPYTGLIDELFLYDEALTLEQINNLITVNIADPIVPEPSTFALLGLGAFGLMGRRRRRGFRIA